MSRDDIQRLLREAADVLGDLLDRDKPDGLPTDDPVPILIAGNSAGKALWVQRKARRGGRRRQPKKSPRLGGLSIYRRIHVCGLVGGQRDRRLRTRTGD